MFCHRVALITCFLLATGCDSHPPLAFGSTNHLTSPPPAISITLPPSPTLLTIPPLPPLPSPASIQGYFWAALWLFPQVNSPFHTSLAAIVDLPPTSLDSITILISYLVCDRFFVTDPQPFMHFVR
ncbi:hypothetical protein E2C01_094528 [Portunus trituberculatus]|uniref:Uncharacterized protein n=1 Tax=Portunus trituberculatus TaxID=210409 RepID=A0A5B7JSM1_PORTR|nr:hypothetical protein [Portunus trituberculatus]